jgi:hypothetical protein
VTRAVRPLEIGDVEGAAFSGNRQRPALHGLERCLSAAILVRIGKMRWLKPKPYIIFKSFRPIQLRFSWTSCMHIDLSNGTAFEAEVRKIARVSFGMRQLTPGL